MKPFRAALAILALAIIATASFAFAQTSGIKTIVGEVVDPACWIVNGAKGTQHKECAIACAKAGQVLAILETKGKKLYLIATDEPGEDPNAKVIDFVAQKVTVTGRTYTRGGVTAIKIAEITPGGK
jgi:type 1 fimbria pilin